MQLKALWEPAIPSVSNPMLSKSGMQLDIVTTHVMLEYTLYRVTTQGRVRVLN